MIKFRNQTLTFSIIFFNKLHFYYVKKNKANLWYKNNIPFFRFGFIIV